VGSLTLVPDT